jgi:hypothetical protein
MKIYRVNTLAVLLVAAAGSCEAACRRLLNVWVKQNGE